MSDETPIHIGGKPRKVKKSVYKGTPAHKIAKGVFRKPKFTIQLLAAYSSDHSIERPYKAFIKDKDIEKQDIKAELDRARARAKQQAKRMIHQAKTDPSSEAAKIVIRANELMHEQHRIDLANKKPNTPQSKRYKGPEKVFKIDKDEFERSAGKGMDSTGYCHTSTPIIGT